MREDDCRSQFALPATKLRKNVKAPVQAVVTASWPLYIIERHLPKGHAYAEETQLYLSFKLDCIEDIRKWMLVYKLKLNDEKTEFFSIGTWQ